MFRHSLKFIPVKVDTYTEGQKGVKVGVNLFKKPNKLQNIYLATNKGDFNAVTIRTRRKLFFFCGFDNFERSFVQRIDRYYCFYSSSTINDDRASVAINFFLKVLCI